MSKPELQQSTFTEAGSPKESQTFLDTFRSTFRNKKLTGLLVVIGIFASCKGSCTFGKKSNEAFSCSCTDSGPKNNNNSDYKRLKVDKSDL